MTTLAARLAPRLGTVLIHPGDAETEPFPLAPLPAFQTATLPPGMAQDMAEQAGLPSPDFARIWLEAVLALVETEGDVTIVDNTQRQAELAELKALRAEQNPKTRQLKECFTECGQPAFRMMIRDFDTDHPVVPCAAVPGHECGVR